jgi:hypothetical protein
MAKLDREHPRYIKKLKLKPWGTLVFNVPMYVNRIDYEGPEPDGTGWKQYHGWQVRYPGYAGASLFFSDSLASRMRKCCTPKRSLERATDYLAEVYAGVTAAERMREMGYA